MRVCSIGIVHHKMGETEKALEYYNKSPEIQTKVHGQDQLDTAKTQNNIGAVYHAQGKLSEALEMWQKSLTTKEKVLGQDHPDVADTYNK